MVNPDYGPQDPVCGKVYGFIFIFIGVVCFVEWIVRKIKGPPAPRQRMKIEITPKDIRDVVIAFLIAALLIALFSGFEGDMGGWDWMD